MSHNRDLLSDIPDEILWHILSFLPTRQSARTSVLSRRWRHLWRCVPTLHFDFDDQLKAKDYEVFMASCRELASAIDQFVALRDAASSLLRFHLHLFMYDFFPLEDPIRNWIGYARSHGVRDMAVSIFWLNDNSTSPPPFDCFFDLPSVETLYLNNIFPVISTAMPKQIELSKLKVLTLHTPSDMRISDPYVTLLLSSCPALQELTLYRGICNKAVEIKLPSLRRLTIKYHNNFDKFCQIGITCPRLEYFHLSNWAHLKHFQGHMPSLLEASISLCYLWTKPAEHFQQIFESLRGVTKLTLCLAANEEVKRNPQNLLNQIRRCPIFHKMKHFTFKAHFSKNYFKEALLAFLRLSPNLLSLDLIDGLIVFDRNRRNRYLPDIVQGCTQQERNPTRSKILDHLKTVSVIGISDERTRGDLLKMLSMHVNEWERVAVI